MGQPISTVTFSYDDFNTTTHRTGVDLRKHSDVKVFADIDGGFYVFGAMGCSKTRATVRECLKDLLGGRLLHSFKEYE